MKEISLSGKISPFRAVLAEAGPQWHATDTHILSQQGVERPEEHRILIDVKPSDKKYVSLYRLRDVWGYSEHAWTPVALRLERVLMDEPQENPSVFKQVFVELIGTKDFVYEFLYLNWGNKKRKVDLGTRRSGEWNSALATCVSTFR